MRQPDTTTDNPSTDMKTQTLLRERLESLRRAPSALDDGHIKFTDSEVTEMVWQMKTIMTIYKFGHK